MELLGYTLANQDKLKRTIDGTPNRLGQSAGGVSKDAAPETILAAYDRLGGLILKDGLKVKMGSFFDFEGKKPRTEPNVTFITEFEGQVIEVDEAQAKSLAQVKEEVAKIRRKTKDEDVEDLKPRRKKK